MPSPREQYVNSPDGTVSIIRTPAGVSVLTTVRQLIPHPTSGNLYVVTLGTTPANRVWVVNPITGSIIADIALAATSAGYGCYCPSNDCIYLFGATSGSVSVISCATNTLVATIAGVIAGAGFALPCYCPTSDRIYFGDTANIRIVDPNTNTFITVAAAGATLRSSCYVSSTDRVWFQNQAVTPSNQYILTPITNVLATFASPGVAAGTMTGIVYASAADRVHLTSNVGAFVIRPDTQAVTNIYGAIGINVFIPYSATRERLYYNGIGGSILVVDARLGLEGVVGRRGTVGATSNCVPCYNPVRDRVYTMNDNGPLYSFVP